MCVGLKVIRLVFVRDCIKENRAATCVATPDELNSRLRATRVAVSTSKYGTRCERLATQLLRRKYFYFRSCALRRRNPSPLDGPSERSRRGAKEPIRFETGRAAGFSPINLASRVLSLVPILADRNWRR